MNTRIDELRASMHWHYFQVCRDHVTRYEAIEAKIKDARNSTGDRHIVEMNIAAESSQRERSVVIPIVFAAMCLEAFIFDYGAQHLSKSYVSDHIDKLEMPSKFVVLSELVSGKKFPTSSHAYERLVQLVKDRNSLVHFKSKGFSFAELQELAKWHEEMNAKLRTGMYNAYKCVLEVMKEMYNLHKNQTNYFATFAADAEYHA